MGVGKWRALALSKRKEKIGKGYVKKPKNWSPAQVRVRTNLQGHAWGSHVGLCSTWVCTKSSCILREPTPQEKKPRRKLLAQSTGLLEGRWTPISVWDLVFAMVGPSAGPKDPRQSSTESRAGERKANSCVLIKSQVPRPDSLSQVLLLPLNTCVICGSHMTYLGVLYYGIFFFKE